MDYGVEPTTSQTLPKILLGKYEVGRLLGRGTYAKVYHARSVEDHTGVAIKVIDKKKISGTTMEPRIVREVSVMHRLNHPNIVKLHEVMATKSNIYLVMEHAKGGELLSQIVRDGPLTEPVARRYFHQLISALHYCHSNGITHRDIKPQNLLLDLDGDLKVSDFGLSALPEQSRDDGLLHTACGTPAFTAPEVVRRKGYDGAKADTWSCGIILFLLLAGYLPFNDANIVIMYQKIYNREFEFPNWFSKSVRQVITRLLDPNPETRITIEELMRLSWFKRSLRSNLGSSYNSFLPKDNPINLTTTKKDSNFDHCAKPAPSMNAFDIISLSSGLDLSGLFERAKRRVRRFTSIESAEKIQEKFEEVGATLGYLIEKTKIVAMKKRQTTFSVSISEFAPSLLLVEVKAIGNDGEEFEDLCWGDFKVKLEEIVFEWHKDGF